MIYIVHGTDYGQTRKLIINQQKKLGASNKTELNINDISPSKLMECAATFDIFGTAPFIILDITDTKAKEYDAYIDVLKKIPQESTVLIQSYKALGKTNPFIKNAQALKAKIAQSDLEIKGNIFKFVDYVFDKNRRESYKELQTLLKESTDYFYIFSMLLYGLRTVASAKFNSTAFSQKSGFVKTKAERHAGKYTESEIIKLFSAAYNSEKALKLGEIQPTIAVTLFIEKVLV